ncbi:hypothetical protein AA103196_1274 [Ameyamaea chiangmaiensis NBRC 103196]|uniref:CHAP domain-containing protein n=1 Tax=Ameyamaea chiangmaiensis TaxID=442969 RepID=A0A850PC74_9PROT|nr:CHAP domain-containing protein [Ameyamaea chiangmaiensis]MBS4074990.1 CHAP domain-containing protein [Ameyamaea chiangmaiensis]NVN41548.1 CHAP domain-containing protein [Ameyamaea chiangmaiensis]GBQ66003.1 hypothetical protein AA103196_1274 [Ameyamaea chiangmaiensis NBRC 103196]
MRRLGLKLAVLSLTAAFSFSTAHKAEARHRGVAHASAHGHASAHHASSRRLAYRYAGGHVIQCVAFAKSNSEIALRGNAADWWYHAAGVYARGASPEAGSVLNFRATRRMPLGHVAVVTDVVNSRTIVIDQSHWAQRGISRNVQVVDVSPSNDWSAVRVQLNGRSGTFGSIYPTYGFIYARAADGRDTMMASAAPASRRGATRSLPSALSHPFGSTEVAEAPAGADSLGVDAPDRNLR